MAVGNAVLFDSALTTLFTTGGTQWDDGAQLVSFILLKDTITMSTSFSTYADVSSHVATDADYEPGACNNRTVTLNGGAAYFSSDPADFGNSVTITAKYLACLIGDPTNLQSTDKLLWYIDLNAGFGSVQVQAALFRVSPATTPINHWFYIVQG